MANPPPDGLKDLLRLALAEDLGEGDVTSMATIDANARGEAVIRAKQELIVSGLRVLEPLWNMVDPDVKIMLRCRDGDRLAPGETVAVCRGLVRSLLAGERVCLNLLGRLCGVATQTARLVTLAGKGKTKILDTRKTTPGLRLLEKEAVRHGGGYNHRFGLYDQMLVKDNHLRACGGVTAAIRRVRAFRPHLSVEVEVTNENELREAIAEKADVVMLDNMDLAQIARCMEIAGGRVLIEVSGNIQPDVIAALAAIGVDRISIGALTHSAPSADLNMKLTTPT